MNSYNGFSPAQRYKALAYHKAQIKAGVKAPKPQRCDGCGTSQGFLAWHSEDYSEPFGPHIGEYGVCYRCHMHIHCRFRNPNAFADYADLILSGKRFMPYMNGHWERFKAENLKGRLAGELEDIVSFDVSNSLIVKLYEGEGPLI